MLFGSDVNRTTEHTELVMASTALRDRVDPASTLPEVILSVFEKEDHVDDFSREKVSILHSGEPAGICDLITDYQRKIMHFDVITLDTTERIGWRFGDLPKRDRPKGLGLASYLIAIETAHSRGMPFESQADSLSMGSNRVWEILVQRGVAVVVKPPGQYNDGWAEKVSAKYLAPVFGVLNC